MIQCIMDLIVLRKIKIFILKHFNSERIILLQYVQRHSVFWIQPTYEKRYVFTNSNSSLYVNMYCTMCNDTKLLNSNSLRKHLRFLKQQFSPIH